MDAPIEPTARQPRSAFRLTSGLEFLDEWSQNATQVELNIVNQVLFALIEKSVFGQYDVVDDVTKTMEFFVIARPDLTVKVRVHDLESFGIVYIGPTMAAPGFDQAAPDVENFTPRTP